MKNTNKISISISGLEQEIHQLINQERKKYSLKLLDFEIKLSDIAREHSKDMAKRNFFSHINIEGKNPTDRGKSVGYTCHKNYGNYFTEGLGENIFKSHMYNSITYYNGVPYYNWMSQSEIAKLAVTGWMSSPGHRKNILTANYQKEGIGIVISREKNEIFITQNFC